MDGKQENSPGASTEESGITVLISEDRMAASVTITPSPDQTITAEDVLARLGQAGVVYGIDQARVQRLVDEVLGDPTCSTPVGPAKVAQGRPPVHGEGARIEYHPALLEAGGRPKVQPDGTVNLFDLNLVRNVTKGTVLAVRTPPTPGEPGMNVLGATIPAIKGRDERLRAGSGARVSEDGLTLTAEIDGHAARIGDRIQVTHIYQVNRDVSVGTGNIQFLGSVVVRGNVHSGFWVKAEGDVEVQGSIEGGTVEAGGNVTVRYGIQGSPHGRVVSGGTIKARFIENAHVRAGAHVWATDGILHSQVEAGGSVEVLGRRGSIIGGKVTARESVSARSLGSSLGGATEIAVGLLPALREEMAENRKKQAELEESLQRAESAIQFLADQDRRGALPPDKRDTMLKLVKTQEQLFTDLEAVRARSRELERQFSHVRGAWVQATEVCYPGVRVVIGNARYNVTDPLQRVRFRLNEDQEIELAPI